MPYDDRCWDTFGVSQAAEIEQALAALDVRPDTLDDQERAALDRDGYVVLDRLLDPSHLDAVNAAVADQLDRARKDPHWHPGGTLHVSDLLDAGPALDAVWTAPRLLAAVVHLLGADLQARRLHYRSPPGRPSCSAATCGTPAPATVRWPAGTRCRSRSPGGARPASSRPM